MAAASCWFRGCAKVGKTGKIGGRPVALCPIHAAAVDGALGQSDRFEVRWGEWGRDIIRRRERHLAELKAAIDRLPDEDPNDWEDYPTERHRLTWAIEDVEASLASVNPDSPPVISIRELEHHIIE